VFKNYIKGGLRVLGDYAAALLVYVILLYTFIAITGDNFLNWLPVYSFLMFAIMALFLYSDFWRLAAKEKKPQYNLKPYPLKGLVFGLIGILPLAVIKIIDIFIVFGDELGDKLKGMIVDGVIFGPLYFCLKLFEKNALGYIIALLLVPLLTMAAYMLGYYDIKLGKVLGIKKDVVYEKKQTLSPWNPAVKALEQEKNKKKKKKQQL